MWTQLVQPNLSVTGQVGWCLVFARQMFNAPAGTPTAWQGWLNAKYKHTDALPSVAVPCWFSYQTYGHVVVYVPNKGFYSSPYRSGTVRYIGTSIQDIEVKYSSKYVGWSEDINGVRVAQEVNMAEVINDDVSRQIGWHYLGRNGFDGKPNALQSKQGDIFGQPLTNAKLSEFFLSPEARDWRDVRIHKVYGERDALRTANAGLNAQITQLTKAVADKQKVIDAQSAQITGLTQTINEKQAEIDSQSDQIAQLTKENTELKAQLATCGNGDDTEWLNKFGEALRWLITRLGLKG